MRELASVYKRQEWLEEVEKMLNKILQAQELQLGPEHISTVYRKRTLAVVYHSQQCRDTVEAGEKSLGIEHPDTLAIMHELALVYDLQERYGDAEELFKLLSGEKQFGSDHPNVLLTRHNLGRLHHLQGRSEDPQRLPDVSSRIIHADVDAGLSKAARIYVELAKDFVYPSKEQCIG